MVALIPASPLRPLTRRAVVRTGAVALGAAAILPLVPSASAQSAAGAPPAMPEGSHPAQPGGNGGSGGGPGGSSGRTISPIAGEDGSQSYKLSGGADTLSGKAFVATADNESGVWVTDAGALALSDSSVTSSGNTTSADESSFYGLNAVVLADSASTITLQDVTISSTGEGANGIIATGESSSVTATGGTIDATGDAAHGVMATAGGAVTLTDVSITTTGAHGAPLATDRGGGTVTATGGTYTSSGAGSPGIYSTGTIAVTNGTFACTNCEAVVVEGSNIVTTTDCAFTVTESENGVMLYQSFSGDAEGQESSLTMTGGSLACTLTTGAVFYVTNSIADVILSGVAIDPGNAPLARAGEDQWGTSGANGGTLTINASGQTLSGDAVADASSSITIALADGSEWSGAMDAEGTAKATAVTLDATSTWTVTADSHVTALTLAEDSSGGTLTTIAAASGITVTYDATASSALAGKTYTLTGGGTLAPAAS